MSAATTTPAERAGYRPALDGLRAVAVVSVMVFHSATGWAPGGFLGVDVFFVLSGYLITGLLLSEHARWGSVDILGFYRARARRLLPALFVVVTAVVVIGPHLLTAGARSALRGDAIASLLYVANWRFIVEGDSYFQQIGDPSPFRHMWTLAIEEQYYLAFPVLLAGMLAVAGRRTIATVLGVAAAASAVWGAVLLEPGADPSRIYFGTDTRVHEILIGAVLAVLMPAVRRTLVGRRAVWLDSSAIAALALVVIAFLVAREDDTFLYRGGTVLLSLLVVIVLVAVETAPTNRLGRLLGRAPLAATGRLSYGLYLWHWPVFVALSPARTGWDAVPLFVVQVGVTVALALLSYRLVEQPIRHGSLRRLGTRGRALAAGATPVVLAVVLLSTAHIAAAPPSVAAGGSVATTIGEPGATHRILIVGDSVGFAWGYSYPKATYPDVSVTGIVKQGCGTAEQRLVVNGSPWKERVAGCDDQFATWTPEVDSLDPQLVIWSLGAWEVFDHYVDGAALTVGSAAYDTYLTGRMEDGLEALGSSVQVVIPDTPCYDQPGYVVEGQDVAPDRNDPRRAAEVNAIVGRFAAAHPDRVHVVDTASWLCPDGRYVEKQDGVSMRYDGVHYTEDGVTRFWAWLMPQIQQYLRG